MKRIGKDADLQAAGGEGSSALASVIDAAILELLPSLVTLYRELHSSPELSGQEKKTATLVAGELKSLGYQVTEGIGKYDRHEWPGYGVVAVMRNGEGPTVLLRGDMDALPVEEKTGLSYASRARGIFRDGSEVPVMHACGHDIHVTSLIGAATLLARMKDEWQGTVVLVGQPGEEGGGGARAMLNDGAYLLCPRPDYALALHVTLQLEAGTVGYLAGNFMASFTDIEVVVRGIGSHGSTPELGKDPIVMAAQLVLALQTLMSREKSPFEPAVLTVGAIHGGTACNIIPEEVVLQLSLRTYDPALRDRMVNSIERIARGIALTAGLPEEKAPLVRIKASHPVNYNDPELTDRVASVLKRELGEGSVLEASPVMVSEDFGSWSLEGEIASCMFWLGGADPAQVEESRRSGVPLPSHHSPLFAPLAEPTIRCGVKAMTWAALDLFGR